MDHLLLARGQMAFSLGFHIIFAAIGMVMPFFLYVAYRAYVRGGREEDLRLTKAWMRGTAILFATGAVSGTALSFQLGLLWPTFMEHAGPIFGMPFSLEGAAFFLEAIFLGLFLYGWGRVPQRLHLLFALLIGVCGLSSGVLVIAANGWMNAPAGFTWVDGQAHDIDVWAAMFNRAWPLQSLHMVVAAFQATTLGAMGLHAVGLLQKPGASIHRRAMRILAPFFVVSSLVQPVVGDLSAKSVADRQPEKLAAMEAHFHTQTRAPLLIGGIPDPATETVSFAIRIPGGLSFLAHGDFDAEVTGLDAFPRDEWPPVVVTHLAFQVMVGLGMVMVLLSLIWILAAWRRWNLPARRVWLWTLVVSAPVGFVALEAGWVVTEVGRQPWIIYRIMKTADAVTPVTGLEWSFLCIVVLYLSLGAMAFYFLWKWMRLETARS